MNTAGMAVRPAPESYLVDNVRYPFCRGCGHTSVMRKLNEALTMLAIPPGDVSLVTDIGCIGLADSLFDHVHTVHTTHGRSTAFATGIGLADKVLAEGRLHLIVLIGDGGAMIGLQHLVHAAMLNVNITVLVCNNFVYGMTGGQGSGLTPECFVTSTTPTGNIVPPADLCGILVSSNAAFVARSISTEPGLAETIRDAIAYPGFAAVEILELCTEFAVPNNQLTGKRLREIAEQNGWQIGRISEKTGVQPYETRLTFPALSEPPKIPAPPRTKPGLARRVSMVVGGSAGEKIQSAAAAACKASIRSGLYATLKNDNPVTQGSGFSLAELSVSPTPIRFTGVERADVIIAISPEGMREVKRRGSLEGVTESTLIILDEALEPPGGPGELRRIPLRKIFGPTGAGLAALLYACEAMGVLSREEIQSIADKRLPGKGHEFDTMIQPPR